MSDELGELPLAVRLLGEDLVLYRDGSGNLGLLHRHCAHRGASLEYGIIAECGIICCYHGWHYANDGTLISAGSEAPDSPIHARVVQGAYPVHEHNSIIFAYLTGPGVSHPSRCTTRNICPRRSEKRSQLQHRVTGCRSTRTPRTPYVLHLHARSSGGSIWRCLGS